MTKQVQRRRGTATQHTSFTGAEGEISVNTTNKSVHVHDGVTAGGVEAARADLSNVTEADVSAALAGATDVDINGGNIDGTVIGANSAAAITGTTITGTSFVTSGNMTFGDNDKAIFGAGSDLQIYHDGSNGRSYIVESGSSNLYIAGENLRMTNTAGDEFYLLADANGEVSLRHNNAQKLATTSTGIDVTGTVTADGLTVEGNYATFSRTSGIDVLVGDNTTNSGYIGTNTAHNFYLFSNGSKRLQLDTNGDISFYEDTGTTAKFFWDASAESLGIGTSSPKNILSIGVASGAEGVAFQSADNNYNSIWYSRGGGNLVLGTMLRGSTTVSNGFVSSNSGNFGKSAAEFGYGTIRFFTDPASAVTEGNAFTPSEAMRITSSGSVGIGTSSPLQALHVNSGTGNSAAIFESTDATSQIWLKDSASSSTYQTGIACYGDNLLLNNGGERMRIDSSGRVGIGTSSPSEPLTVNGNIFASTGDGGGYKLEGNSGIFRQGITGMGFNTNGSEAMRIDSSGNLLVGTTTTDRTTDDGVTVGGNGFVDVSRTSDIALRVTRRSSDGEMVRFRNANGSTVGSIAGTNGRLAIGDGDTGLRFAGDFDNIQPFNVSTLSLRDNAIDLGSAVGRFDDIFATNGTIQTSDRNEKQDIEALSDAEQRVAVACKGLLRKFRWKDAVAEKGDDARIHFGIIAQDLQDAFTAEGLDAGRYAMFISSTWWETQTEVPAVEAVAEVLDEEGNVIQEAVEAKEAYTRTDTYDTAEEAPAGATERTRLGVRYPELLAFIIAAI